MARSPFLAFLLIAVVLSGCTSRTETESETSASSEPGLVPVGAGTGNTTAPPAGPSPATMNLTQDPVDIQDGGDLATGVDKDWSWHVAPGYTTFTVEVFLKGTQDAPEYVLQGGYTLSLAGGDPHRTVFEEGSGGGVSISGAANGCKLCYDGADEANQPGQWTLHFDAGQSVAEYSVHVVVSY